MSSVSLVDEEVDVASAVESKKIGRVVAALQRVPAESRSTHADRRNSTMTRAFERLARHEKRVTR